MGLEARFYDMKLYPLSSSIVYGENSVKSVPLVSHKE